MKDKQIQELEKRIEELATEQNVQPLHKLEQVLGSGSSLWSDDEDFEEFLAATSGAKGGENKDHD